MHDPVRNPYISPEAIDNQSAAAFGSSMRAQVRVGQIITFALVQGTLVIAGVMVYMALDQKPQVDNDATPFLVIGIVLGAGACVIALAVSSTIRRLAVQRFREKSARNSGNVSADAAASPAVNELLARLQSSTLVGQAAMEGAAVANAVLLMLSGNLLHLAVITVMLIGIIWQTPTVGKRQRVIEEAMI